jgi:TM2 domain-containing membrane protein YozV
MDNKNEVRPNQKEKSPALAAFLAIFPGMGAIYNGNIIKGFAYMLIFAVLIVLTDNANDADGVVFGLMIAGFFIYQVIDSYNEAGKINQNVLAEANPAGDKEDLSLFSAITVLLVGIVFQIANFELITYRQVTRLWPLVLIIFGVKIVYDYFKKEENKNGKS